MNILDRLFPQWSFNRHVKKMALERLLEHDKTHRRHPSRRMGPQSGDAVMDNARAKTRESARWLEENNAIAVSILESLITQIIGDGTKVEPLVKGPNGKLLKDTNKAIKKAYDDFMQSPDVTGELCGCAFEGAIVRSWLRDGEIFGQHVANANGFNYATDLRYAVELIEADMIPFVAYQGFSDYVHGVRKNAWGQPTRYLVYKEHPGNTWGMLKGNPQEVKTVPADRLFHVKLTKRIGQTRGISLFHSAIDTLLDLDHYEDSERVAARVAACQTMVIKSGLTAATTEIGSDNVPEYKLSPNAVWQLGHGEEAQMFSPDRPNTNLDAFVMSQIRRAAGGTMSSASSVSRNYNGTYSSQRQELVEHHQVIARLRKIYYDAALSEIYRRVVLAALNTRNIPITGIDEATLFDVDFRGAAMPWIDPQKEAQAAKTNIEIGVKSRLAYIRERGDDPEQITQELLNDEFEKSKEQKAQKLALSQARPNVEPTNGGGTDESEDEQRQSRTISLVNRHA